MQRSVTLRSTPDICIFITSINISLTFLLVIQTRLPSHPFTFSNPAFHQPGHNTWTRDSLLGSLTLLLCCSILCRSCCECYVITAAQTLVEMTVFLRYSLTYSSPAQHHSTTRWAAQSHYWNEYLVNCRDLYKSAPPPHPTPPPPSIRHRIPFG